MVWKLQLLLALFRTVFAYNLWRCPNEPVCATDGNTYNSECAFRASKMDDQNLQIILHAACPPLYEYKPQPYPTFLKLMGAHYTQKPKYRIRKARNIILLALSVSETYGRKCPYQPVCASDGKTYNSTCDFLIGRMEDQDLQVMFDGHCESSRFLKLLKSFNEPSKPYKSKYFLGIYKEN